ncbi:hypothetical protein H5V45_07495 [Nocardioides sp. KIGAM211]|uniref:Uncharacterized protein n=1 Tax=Nocardioides luti TaxID=2761101 RepID=A0A7X0VBG9_9ACTN|nr:hypothetical protein [Nocardioides luti]MBB6627163.1 hypothetical protein [Nocardioides luti]
MGTEPDGPSEEDEAVAQAARDEQVRADARRARARAAERAETVDFVRELGFGELLDDDE